MSTLKVVLSHSYPFDVQNMRCTENIREIDYYNEILYYFEKTTGHNVFVFDQNDKWADYSYIRLMNELKNNKVLLDADIGDVTRNCLILILSLIEMRQRPTGTPYECCSNEQQAAIKKSLINVIA
ncbi:MAG: hypothetical protein JW776_07325 [Candidatus Lokiarchaeota archaeon]|nr:hypothetical protein [Candidatus Lokiarchaeota archaeon]